MSDRDDRSDRLDLRAWAAPPTPADLVDRVLDQVARAETGAALPARPAAVAAVVPEPVRPRAAWPRYVAVAVGGATIAAAATLWLAARPRAIGPAGGARTAAAALSTIELGDGVTAVVSAGALVRWERVAGDGGDPRPEVTVTQTTGAVEYRSTGAARLRLSTPLAMIDAGATPAHLVVSPWLGQEDPMKRSSLAIGGGAAVLAAGVAIAVYQGQAGVRPTDGAPRTLEAGEQLALAPATTPAPARPALVVKATRDRALRDQVATAIAAAQARRAAQAGSKGAGVDAGLAIGPGGTGPDDDELPIKREDIRQGVREVAPMLGDCYQQELLDQGVLSDGKLIAHLTVETEPDLGTVVTVDDQQPTELDFVNTQEPGSAPPAAAQQAALTGFSRCVELTLESVVLPPMNADGRLSITYPFVFAHDDGDDDGDDDDDDGSAGSAGSGSGARERTAQRDAPRPRRLEPAPPIAPSPREPTKSAEELLREANSAAASGTWGQALLLAEQALKDPDIDEKHRSKAITVAGLAACNTHDVRKARKNFALANAARQTMLRQACLKQGIELL